MEHDYELAPGKRQRAEVYSVDERFKTRMNRPYCPYKRSLQMIKWTWHKSIEQGANTKCCAKAANHPCWAKINESAVAGRRWQAGR